MRFAALSIVVLACLVAPGRAAAHSRAPTVALDYRLELSRATLPGVHAQVVDGDRALRVRVEPPHRLLVLGLLGEPLLRFGPGGVWVNRASPSADADRLTRRGSGWLRLTSKHALLWHGLRCGPGSSRGSLPSRRLRCSRMRRRGAGRSSRPGSPVWRPPERLLRLRPSPPATRSAGVLSGSRSDRPRSSHCSPPPLCCLATDRCGRGRRWSSAWWRRHLGSGR